MRTPTGRILLQGALFYSIVLTVDSSVCVSECTRVWVLASHAAVVDTPILWTILHLLPPVPSRLDDLGSNTEGALCAGWYSWPGG